MVNTVDLAKAFCDDCQERMQRACEILREGVPLSRVQLDQLHQEFDTLYCGARAVHLPELENYFSGMARHARFLRNFQESGLEVGVNDWMRLLTEIETWFGCSNELPCGISCNKDLLHLLHDLELRLLNKKDMP